MHEGNKLVNGVIKHKNKPEIFVSASPDWNFANGHPSGIEAPGPARGNKNTIVNKNPLLNVYTVMSH
jgi:hypothetical protein